jgi:hypothetical protein
LFGTLKYEHLYRAEIAEGDALAVEINWFRQVYNSIRPHQALGDRTPARPTSTPDPVPARRPDTAATRSRGHAAVRLTTARTGATSTAPEAGQLLDARHQQEEGARQMRLSVRGPGFIHGGV